MLDNLTRLHPGPLSPAKLAHFVIRTNQLQKTRDWYRSVLNATIVFENEMCSFMTYDEEHHRVGVIRLPQLAAADPHAVGVEHIAFTYRELSELLATFARLRTLDIGPYWSVIHGPTVSIYYKDPNAVKVELQYDVFRTSDEIAAYFAAGHHEENFVGITFDPEEMIQRFNRGVPVSDLIRRPPLPAGKTPWDMLPAEP